MQALFKFKLGVAAIVTGLAGALWGVGAAQASDNMQSLVAAVGVAVTSSVLMWLGTLLVQD